MKIGIIGVGIVGSAIKYGFEKLGHQVFVHDIVLDTKIADVIDSEIIYICVPTPAKDNGECDCSIVNDTVFSIVKLNYSGVIAVKSTCIPMTIDSLINHCQNQYICFVPEFLRERCAVHDFTEDHQICIVGTHDDYCYEVIKESHGSYPKKFIKLKPTEAEICKYFHNVYNAMNITFANAFYELCQKMDADYKSVKDAVSNERHISNMYLDCNDNFRGFGGTCLPKDVSAITRMVKDIGLSIDLFDAILSDNKKYLTTVFEGMRK